MNLIAIVNNTEQIIETMWGDPNRWDDWQRRIYKLYLTLSAQDQREGYSLERLDLYEAAENPGQGSIEKSVANPLGISTDSLIVIKGPLYRADTFAFRAHELTDEQRPVQAMPFKGYSGSKTIDVEYYDGEGKKDRRRQLPPLSLKTAIHAIAYLPEGPLEILSSDRSPPAGLAMMKDFAEYGAGVVRKKYFPVE